MFIAAEGKLRKREALARNAGYLAKNPDWQSWVRKVSDQTGTAYVERWIKAAERNKTQFGEFSFADIYHNQGWNCVAVCVGASPALNGNVNELRYLDDRFVLIGVSSGLRFLLENNIKPHFVMHADVSDKTAQYFEGLDTRGMTLIANCFSSPEALKLWQGDIRFLPIAINGTRAQCRRYSRATGRDATPPGAFPALGNQFNFGVGFSYFILGCKTIILCGVEYAIYGERYYAGTRSDIKDKWERQIGPCVDIHGEPAYTLVPLYQAKLALEGLLSMMDGVFINATESGILGVNARHGYLPWIQQMSLRDAIYLCGKAVDEARKVNQMREVI